MVNFIKDKQKPPILYKIVNNNDHEEYKIIKKVGFYVILKNFNSVLDIKAFHVEAEVKLKQNIETDDA